MMKTLTQEQCAALDASLPVQLDLHGSRITISPPLSLPYTTDMAPSFDQQKYIRAYARPNTRGNVAAATEEVDEEAETDVTVDDRDTYRVYGKVDVENQTGNPSSHILPTSQTYLLRRLASSSTEYYLLEYKQEQGQHRKLPMPIEDTLASATLTGPTGTLSSLFAPALVDLLDSSYVAVALSPSPVAQVPPPLRGDLRGYSNMPPLASRVVSCPVIASAPTPAMWEKLLHPIGKVVDLLCHHGTAVELRCREIFDPRTEQASSAHPLVIITARPKSSKAARACIYQTQHILCLYKYCDIEVEIGIGSISRADAGLMPQPRLIKYAQHPSMGVSIGTDELATRGSSAGGFVHVSRDNQRIPGLFVMTNHHAVSRNSAPLPVQEINLNRPVNCPTRPLVEESLKLAKRKVKEETEEYCQSQNMKIADESRRMAEIQIAKTRLDQAKQREKDLQNAIPSLHLGHTYASSGLTSQPTKPREGDKPCCESEIDWALIEVDPTRVGRSPYNNTSVPIDRFPTAQDRLHQGLSTFQPLPGLLNSSSRREIWRVNRYDEVTYGYLDLYRVRTRFVDRGAAGLAYTVSYMNGAAAFASSGDSGSWIMDSKGNVVGMFFASNETRLEGPRGYFMDIMEVTEHILACTGLTVDMAF